MENKEIKTNLFTLLMGAVAIALMLVFCYTWYTTNTMLQQRKELEKAYMYGYTDGALNGIKTAHTKSKERFLFHKRMDSLLYHGYVTEQFETPFRHD